MSATASTEESELLLVVMQLVERVARLELDDSHICPRAEQADVDEANALQEQLRETCMIDKERSDSPSELPDIIDTSSESEEILHVTEHSVTTTSIRSTQFEQHEVSATVNGCSCSMTCRPRFIHEVMRNLASQSHSTPQFLRKQLVQAMLIVCTKSSRTDYAFFGIPVCRAYTHILRQRQASPRTHCRQSR